MLEDGRTGWLVPPASPGPLAAALEEALSHPEEARRRGTAARQEVRERLSVETMVKRHEHFYRRVARVEGAR